MARRPGIAAHSGRPLSSHEPVRDRALESDPEESHPAGNYYLPGELEALIVTFVEHYIHQRYHETLGNLVPTGAMHPEK